MAGTAFVGEEGQIVVVGEGEDIAGVSWRLEGGWRLLEGEEGSVVPVSCLEAQDRRTSFGSEERTGEEAGSSFVLEMFNISSLFNGITL